MPRTGGEAVAGLAERLKAAREGAGLSQTDAADRSGVHQVSITRFETGKREPSVGTLYKLATAYGVNVCDLLPGGVLPTEETERPLTNDGKKGARRDT